MILLSAKTSTAQDVKPETGNLDFLAGETQLNVVFDYTGMKVSELAEEYYLKQKKMEFRKPADQEKFVKQWDADKAALWEPAFLDQLNKGLKKQQIEADKGISAKYTVKVTLQKIEPGYYTGSNTDKRDAFVNIYIQFIETQNPSNVLCTMQGEKLFGISSDLTSMKETSFRIKMCFDIAGEKTAKCIDKICTLKDKETIKAAKKKEEVLPYEKEEESDKEVTDEDTSTKKNKKSKTDQEEEKPAPSDKGKKKGDKKIDKELDE
jgi:hypothetical protein